MDDPNLKTAADRERINVHQDHEVRYWTEALGVTRNELVAAVEKVGVMAKDVRDYLDTEKNRRRG